MKKDKLDNFLKYDSYKNISENDYYEELIDLDDENRELYDFDYNEQCVKLAVVSDILIMLLCYGVYGLIYYTRAKIGVVSISFTDFVGVTTAGICFEIAFTFGFVGRIIRRKFKKEYDIVVEKDFNSSIYRNKLEAFLGKYIIPVVLPIFGIMLLLYCTPALVITSDGIIAYNFDDKDHISYSQVQVYQVEGDINEDNKFEKYDGVYYDFVKDDFVYSIGPIKNQNKIKELNLIFENNNITPKKIKTDIQFYEKF